MLSFTVDRVENFIAELREQMGSGRFRDPVYLSGWFHDNLLANVTKTEIGNEETDAYIAGLLVSRMTKNHRGQTVLDVFFKMEEIARQEIIKSIPFGWFDNWSDYYSLGNWLSSPDWIDFMEMFLRVQEELGVELQADQENADVWGIGTVGETVKFVWSSPTRTSDRPASLLENLFS